MGFAHMLNITGVFFADMRLFSPAKTMPSFAVGFIDIIVLLATFAFVIFLAYFSLRLMGRARGVRSSGNVKVVEATSVGFQNTVQLVRAGDKFFLIGVSRTGITLIGEVNADAINIETKAMPDMSFDKYLSKFFNKDKKDNDQDGEQG